MNLEARVAEYCRKLAAKNELKQSALDSLNSVTEMLRRNGWRLTVAFLQGKSDPCHGLLLGACEAVGAPLRIAEQMSAAESLRRQAIAVEVAAQLDVFGAVFLPQPTPIEPRGPQAGEP